MALGDLRGCLVVGHIQRHSSHLSDQSFFGFCFRMLYKMKATVAHGFFERLILSASLKVGCVSPPKEGCGHFCWAPRDHLQFLACVLLGFLGDHISCVS